MTLILQECEQQPLFLIYYGDSGTEFFKNCVKYSSQHSILKNLNIDINDLKDKCDFIYKQLEENRSRRLYLEKDTYINVVRVSDCNLKLLCN